MLRLVISGGQTGADLGGLRAAERAGRATGGYAPKGWMTELGPRPALLKRYGLKEYHSGYAARTLANLLWADETWVIANKLDGGSLLTRDLCIKHGKPVTWIFQKELLTQGYCMAALGRKLMDIEVLNVAGNRESKAPGIEEQTYHYLHRIFIGDVPLV